MEAKAICDIVIGRLPDAVREFSDKTADPYLVIEPTWIGDVATLLRDHPDLRFDMLLLVTGVDRCEFFEVVYHLTSLTFGHRITLKSVLPRENPRIASTARVWPAAEWHERETYDLLGIVFADHPDLRRILLPDDWEGHPLRKDYVPPESYHGISNAPE